MTEYALGVEIAQDRSATSIVACGDIEGEDDVLLVDLLAYLPTTDATAAIVELIADREVVAVAIDPHSPGSTLIRPLTDAGVKVTEPSTGDVAVSHGLFLDRVRSGRLRHAGQRELTAAVKAGTPRPLSGAEAWDRRGSDVDAGPAIAAELALWAWTNRPPKLEPLAAWS